MGLDMYLTKKHYVQKWDHHAEDKRFDVTVTKGGKEYPHINKDKVTYVLEEAAYWRKANAIHGWFVNNVQKGIDECQESRVGLDKIKELIEICKKVINDNSLAEELLPATPGFFFGGYDYDEWYFGDLQRTVEMLEPLLADADEDGHLPYDLYYQSSW